MSKLFLRACVKRVVIAYLLNERISKINKSPLRDQTGGDSGLALLGILALSGERCTAAARRGAARARRSGPAATSAPSPAADTRLGVSAAFSPASMHNFPFRYPLLLGWIGVEVLITVPVWIRDLDVVLALGIHPRGRESLGSGKWDGHVGRRAVVGSPGRGSVLLALLEHSGSAIVGV